MKKRKIPEGDRDGATFDQKFDRDRLNKQCQAVYDCVRDNKWYTLQGLSARTGYPEASISARLRDLRKLKFGGFEVLRKRTAGGLHFYKLLPPLPLVLRPFSRRRKP